MLMVGMGRAKKSGTRLRMGTSAGGALKKTILKWLFLSARPCIWEVFRPFRGRTVTLETQKLHEFVEVL